jgi:nicotinate phosphoribosyltransferase
VNELSALLTDFYEITMAYAYWRLGMAEREAVFHLFFRRPPFQGNYIIQCGLANVIDYILHWRFKPEELDYLQSLRDAQNDPLFSTDFLDYLSRLRFTGDIHAIPEGQLVFGKEPVLRVRGPILQCQLLETPLINLSGFASLIATKASRVCAAAEGDSVMEFGLRRSQGPDGGMTASRSAFIGGCDSVSNAWAAKMYGITPAGTMAHSWIMAFADEMTAFKEFSRVMSHYAVLLVDTYDTIEGVKNAIVTGQLLRANGQDLLGIRLDSGDLAELSRQARMMLDEAGFVKTKIVASGDLDEYQITQLKQQGAPIDIWGVGTRLTTGWDQPALDAAYKLSAIQNEKGDWEYKVKRSNQISKSTTPGIQQIRRFFKNKKWLGDLIYDDLLGIDRKYFAEANREEDLLLPIFSRGKLIYQSPSLNDIRSFCRNQQLEFHHSAQVDYPVQLECRLEEIKNKLLESI